MSEIVSVTPIPPNTIYAAYDRGSEHNTAFRVEVIAWVVERSQGPMGPNDTICGYTLEPYMGLTNAQCSNFLGYGKYGDTYDWAEERALHKKRGKSKF